MVGADPERKYVPGTQSVLQKADPIAGVNLPMGHDKHCVPPAVPMYVSIAHNSQTVAPDNLTYLPAAHSSQTDDPMAVLILPAGHALHAVDPESAYLPATQFSQNAPPFTLNLPAGQAGSFLFFSFSWSSEAVCKGMRALVASCSGVRGVLFFPICT